MKASYAFLCLFLLATTAMAQTSHAPAAGAVAAQVGSGRVATDSVGGGHNRVTIEARHADGSLFYRSTTHNLRTNAGADWQASVMGNTAAPPATCNYIGVSSDTTSPALTDTTLAGEIASNGLQRAQGVYGHSTGNSIYSVAKTFTASGSFTAVQKAALFNASSAGTMCFEATFSPAANLSSGDTLSITWTVSLN